MLPTNVCERLSCQNRFHNNDLLDDDSRSVREGKTNLTQEVQTISNRLEIDAKRWLERVTNLLTSHRFYGSFMSATRDVLRCVAEKLGVKQSAHTD